MDTDMDKDKFRMLSDILLYPP